jgi:alcohol dehydrogenase, propanol-preferring
MKAMGNQVSAVFERKANTTMRAAVLHEAKQPLTLEQVAIPNLEPDDVLVKVEVCGVCHSDLSIMDGEWAQLKRLTKANLIPGHEVVGEVVEKGDAVTHLEIGDRVGVAWLHWSCGACELCKDGLENLCPSQKITGLSQDGGFAEFIKAKASHALKVPQMLDSAAAAPLFCAGVTSYRAVKNAHLQAGQRLAVFGIGGLGHLVVQIAKAQQAQVIAVDIADDKLALAKEIGADFTINALNEDVAKTIRKQGGAHAVVVTANAKAAFQQAFSTVRSAGTLVVVGLPSEDLNFAAIQMREIKITSAATGTRADQREVLNLAAEGKIACRTEASDLASINQIFDRMRAGKIQGRVVVKI